MDFAIPAALAAFASAAFVAIKARAWDHQTPLRQAKIDERREAPLVVAALHKHFDCLDVRGTGFITSDCLAQVPELEASASDKRRIGNAIKNAGPHSFVVANPWFLALTHECAMTAIGHKVGTHNETQVVAGLYSPAFAYDVSVDDYGISRADLETYVARVNR